MTVWKTAALATALAGAAGLGAAVAPAGYAQSARTAPRAIEIHGFGSARIGVTVSDLDAADAKGAAGVRIESVEEDSPAAKAGFRKGDVITEFDGERVRSVRQFTRLVSETPAGRSVSAAVQRDGQRVVVSVTPAASERFEMLADRAFERLRRLPDVPAPPAPPAVPRAIEPFMWLSGNQLGVTVQELSEQLAGYFGVKEGVLVTSVADGSVAAKIGMKAGDVITSVNGDEVDDPADLRRRVQQLKDGEELTLSVTRDKKAMTLKGKWEGPRSRTIL